MMRSRASERSAQRGAVALTVAVLLLFTMALFAFFANRSLVFEQRSAANQYRATQAFEMAEAGLEWATAMLNDPRPIDSSCQPTSTGLSFRDRYVPADASFALAPPANAHPSCRIGNGALVCSCPQAGADPALGGGDDPSFGLSFASLAADAQSVLVGATGCTGQGLQCIAGSPRTRSDAVARLSVALKLRPLLRASPAATLTAGGAVTLGGATQWVNLDPATQGSLVVAGSAIDAGAAALTTLPGSPGANALYANDATFGALVHGAGVFNAFFGTTLDRFARSAPVVGVTGSSAVERAAALRAAYEQGFGAFFVDGELQFDASGIGSAARPVLIVTAHAIGCSAPCVIHGLLYADVAARDPSDLAAVSLRGALVTRGDHLQTLGAAFVYDADVLATLRRRVALFVRVPGSWRDF
jgi:hypothetical protein